jgi:hypothetical protein
VAQEKRSHNWSRGRDRHGAAVRLKASLEKEGGNKMGSLDKTQRFDAKRLHSKYLPGKVLRPPRPHVGTSSAFSFNSANASERNDLQYFEMFCNKDIAKARRFSGKINWVQIGATKADHDHSISQQDRLRIVMARQ